MSTRFNDCLKLRTDAKLTFVHVGPYIPSRTSTTAFRTEFIRLLSVYVGKQQIAVSRWKKQTATCQKFWTTQI